MSLHGPHRSWGASMSRPPADCPVVLFDARIPGLSAGGVGKPAASTPDTARRHARNVTGRRRASRRSDESNDAGTARETPARSSSPRIGRSSRSSMAWRPCRLRCRSRPPMTWVRRPGFGPRVRRVGTSSSVSMRPRARPPPSSIIGEPSPRECRRSAPCPELDDARAGTPGTVIPARNRPHWIRSSPWPTAPTCPAGCTSAGSRGAARPFS